MKKIAIFGAGGLGREVLQIIIDINEIDKKWDFQGFLVEADYFTNSSVHGYPVFEFSEWLANNLDASVAVAVGGSPQRLKVVNRIKNSGHNDFATLIHPQAWVGRFVSLGEGAIICSGALITTDIKIGRHVHVNIGVTIGHDVVLGDFSTLNPNVSLSGNVDVGVGAEIGTGSIVVPKCKVGKWAILGAGSVVVRDVSENSTVVGSPARVIKVRECGWEAL